MPEHAIDGCTCDASELDVLLVTPEAFGCKPQIGRPFRMQWSTLAAWLSHPTTGPTVEEEPDHDRAKAIMGAYSIATYRENVRRKEHLIAAGALVVDVDHGGDVDRLANDVDGYAAIILESFKSGLEGYGPRCRILLRLAEPVDLRTYETVHAVIRRHLRAAGYGVDDGAKDASRLSYLPVRRPGTGYRFRVTHGAPLAARAVIAAQPPAPPKPAPVPPPRPEHHDAYSAGALRSASLNVANAAPGERHGTLCREAWSLSGPKAHLSEAEITCGLMPAWVAVAGEHRRAEGLKCIRDAVAARQRGAA
jgi:hypothetical protein